MSPKLPAEVWSKVLSFVVRSHSLAQLCPISPFFRCLAGELLSWEGASGYLRAAELEDSDCRPRFDFLIPRWVFCTRLFVDFQDAHVRSMRRAARRAFGLMGQHCSEAKVLFVRNWCLMERDGFECMRTGFPGLEHLELQNCSFLGYASCARLFEAHPSLCSLRATFDPKAVVTRAFIEATPRCAKALGFVDFGPEREGVVLLSELLERATLEHLWFARTASFSRAMGDALGAAPRALKTLSLPETADNDAVLGMLRSCHGVDLVCFWGEGLPAGAAEAEGFEVLCSEAFSMRIILRRRGSSAALAANGAMWAPYVRSDKELAASGV